MSSFFGQSWSDYSAVIACASNNPGPLGVSPLLRSGSRRLRNMSGSVPKKPSGCWWSSMAMRSVWEGGSKRSVGWSARRGSIPRILLAGSRSASHRATSKLGSCGCAVSGIWMSRGISSCWPSASWRASPGGSSSRPGLHLSPRSSAARKPISCRPSSTVVQRSNACSASQNPEPPLPGYNPDPGTRTQGRRWARVLLSTRSMRSLRGAFP
jgi:hypothetical protein